MVQLDLRKKHDLSSFNLNHMNPLKSENFLQKFEAWEGFDRWESFRYWRWRSDISKVWVAKTLTQANSQ